MTLSAAEIKEEATRLGFELVGIAPAVTPTGFGALRDWLARGFAGEMSYLSRREEAYEHPRHVLPAVRSVVALGTNYRTTEPASAAVGQGRVSRYAWAERDYHDLLRDRLRRLGTFVKTARPGSAVRGVVDTAPLLERDFARLAGLGWFGKNTLLINKRQGSWLFLAALLVDFELEYDAPHETAHCGTCTRCLDACPTDAFPEPYVLDARRCISYLTIELRSPIPRELRPGLGDWLFGCDVCQDVCPWNRKAPVTTAESFQPVEGRAQLDAVELLALDAAGFEAKFEKTPLSRPGRAGLLRNAAIVLGNQRQPASVELLGHALQDVEPLVRGAAAWALGQIAGPIAGRLLAERAALESDPMVLEEIALARDTVNRISSEPQGMSE